ncbi:MAG: energy transducer TonB family protein [Maricaulaceae bacterium]
MSAKDYPEALKNAKAAWKAAERSLGDSKTTGDLAFNYGFLAKARGKTKSAIPALKRAADLAIIGREKGAEVRLEREVELVSAMEKAGEEKDAKERVEKALNFAQGQGLSQTVFAGELLVHESNLCNSRANRVANEPQRKSRTGSRHDKNKNPEEYAASLQKLCAKSAKQALNIFTVNKITARPSYIAAAANAMGYAYERDKDYIQAALSYQIARDAIEEKFGRKNPLVMHTIGRWINARSRIVWNNKLDKAKAEGLGDYWPYVSDIPKVKATKQAQSKMALNALKAQSSGFVVMETDVTDDGRPVNSRIVHSWPDGLYDTDAMDTITHWEFAPKTGSEPADFRKKVTVPLTYIIYNRRSKDAY